MGRKPWGALAVVIAVASIGAGAAWAAVGDLTAQACVEDNDAGPDACVGLADGLGQAREVSVSPDGRDVYAVSFDDDAVVGLRRDAATGAIAFENTCFTDPSSAEACANVSGLDGASSVAVSPDGSSVYVSSEISGAVVHFDRDSGTGALTPQGCVEDDGAPVVGCSLTVAALGDVRQIAVSSDGRTLYAASLASSAIQILDRNTSTGVLTDGDCVEDSAVGASGCATDVNGLASVRSVALSPDAASLYATSESDDAVVRFTRNTTNGDLTGAGCFSDDGGGGDVTCTQVPGLANPYHSVVSPDGRSLYVASNQSSAVKRFDRNTGTGALTSQGCIGNTGSGVCAQSQAGLSAPTRLAASPDNLSVYAAANGSAGVAIFDRDPSTGAIAPGGCVRDDDTGSPGCDTASAGMGGIWGIATSADGASVYTSSRTDNAVAHLAREPAPVPGASVVVRPVKGTVTVRLPGSGGFVPLGRVRSIPVGAEVNTIRGTVSLTSRAAASDAQTAEFRDGRFIVSQSARAGAFTELKLSGPLNCKGKRGKKKKRAAVLGAGGPEAAVAARRGRRLWGSGRGRFRSRGRRGAGTIRGTIWEVSDRCDKTTRIKSLQGTVAARDFVRKRTVILRKGQSYVAPGPRTLKGKKKR
jgi:WD40 repeat protein